MSVHGKKSCVGFVLSFMFYWLPRLLCGMLYFQSIFPKNIIIVKICYKINFDYAISTTLLNCKILCYLYCIVKTNVDQNY